MVSVSTIVLLAVVAVGIYLGSLPRSALPDHLLHHRILNVPRLLSPSVADKLLELSKEMKEFPTNTADLKFYKTLHEHIGEAVPIGADGTCSHPFLVPSMNKSHCVLPGRIDVGRHFILTGGVEGLKEPYSFSVSRLQSFGRYLFDIHKYPVIDRLFASPEFLAAAKTVCPMDKQVLDPFQFNFITQIPGQSVATHIDAPYFWRASRFQVPQWLLAVMVFSNLFDDQFIDQVQVVAYYHRWNDTDRRAGDFVYWGANTNDPERLPAVGLSGSAVDGSKTAHAASVYMPGRGVTPIEKSADTMLRYTGADEVWEVVSNGEVLNTFHTDDLRMTIVYRARCFATKEDVERFRKGLPEEEMLQLEDILATLKADLVRRGRIDRDKVEALGRLDLALLLMNEYIQYPLPARSATLLPYNYCAMTNEVMFPILSKIAKYFC